MPGVMSNRVFLKKFVGGRVQNEYKILTRILSKRLREVVHEIIDECQKGFVPNTFIADATQLLQLIEQYTNDDLDRQGIMLFCDMEKAFDRVSHEFLNDAVRAAGFGPNFCRMINMLYSEKDPARRRMYVNGYYGPWFDVRSGTAQGCPLSPLLFLLVGQALKVFLDNETRIKGISIGAERFKISQYADDTTLLLRNVRELKLANKVLKKWEKATGMKENNTKREGLAMGKLRNMDLPQDMGIQWAKEGEWVISLGVPIGNEVDAETFWRQKIKATQAKSKRWLGMYRSTYFGRTLVVQAMYLGSLRYCWLYSLLMHKSTRWREYRPMSTG